MVFDLGCERVSLLRLHSIKERQREKRTEDKRLARLFTSVIKLKIVNVCLSFSQVYIRKCVVIWFDFGAWLNAFRNHNNFVYLLYVYATPVGTVEKFHKWCLLKILLFQITTAEERRLGFNSPHIPDFDWIDSNRNPLPKTYTTCIHLSLSL